MGILEAIILGIIQGLTEFLPVSSSGHIELGKAILGVEPNETLQYTVIVHAATVLSTIIIFRKDIIQLFKGILEFKWNDEMKFTVNILISMIPVTILGLFFADQIEQFFDGRIGFVGLMLLFTGGLLLLTTIVPEGHDSVTPKSAILIGLAQAIAVLPGISRSGSTIATSLLLKIDRAKAARFSFLMVIPPILGKTALDVKDILETGSTGAVSGSVLIVGFIAAFITGLVACKWMIEIVKRGKIQYFAYYCFAVGVIAIAATWF